MDCEHAKMSEDKFNKKLTFFYSRKELIFFFNEYIKLNYT